MFLDPVNSGLELCAGAMRNSELAYQLMSSNDLLKVIVENPPKTMLGAICGSAQSMDLPAQSMDPLSSIVCADIHGCLRNLWILRRMQNL